MTEQERDGTLLGDWTAGRTQPGRPESPLGSSTDAPVESPATFLNDPRPLGTIAALGELDAPILGALEPRYQVREVIGVGGMGEVRRCHDGAIGREVALKTMRGDDERRARLRQRFLREARIQGQLEHPAIVPVYDLGTGPDGELYFTMRRLRGRTLAAVLTALARGEVATLAMYTRRKLLADFVSVCLAVDYAHSRGVIHRDLKPANIMVGDFGEVYVLDWGVASVIAQGGDASAVDLPATEPTAQVAMIGTPGYMAPEQFTGHSERQDPRTDVYALGAILYEILALRPLLRVRRDALSLADFEDLDARPSTVVPDLPPELDEACVRATALEPADRYASARELARAVERYLDGDRDLARRRELAAHHVEEGRHAAERARREDVTGTEAESARTEAMGAVMKAVALDAGDARARHLLAELITEVPEHLPPSLKSELAETASKTRLLIVRFVVLAMISWVATVPAVAMLGVRDGRSFGLASVLCVLAGLCAAWMWRREHTSLPAQLGLAGLVAATCSALACWLGPFVLVPAVGTSVTVWFTFLAEKRHRWLFMALGGFAVALPYLLEAAGWVPRSFTFAGDTMVLHARGVHLPPLGTTMALLYTSVTFTVLQPLLIGRIRDALSDAERRLLLHSWHLRQLARGTVPAVPRTA